MLFTHTYMHKLLAITLSLLWFTACTKDTPEETVPAPNNFKVENQTHELLTLAWQSESQELTYHLSYRKKGENDYSTETSTTEHTHTFTGLTASTTYEVRIRAKSNKGKYSSYASIEGKTLVQGAPTTPTGLVVSEQTSSSFKFTWTASTASAGNSIASYYLSYREKNENDYSTEISATELTHTFTNLTENKTYEVRVRAKDNKDNYSAYALIETKTLEKGIPTAPTNLAVSEKTQTSFKLTWAASTASDGSSIASYHLSYREKGENDYSTETSTTVLTHAFTDLTENKTYEVRVRAKDNKDNYSAYALVEVQMSFGFTFGGSDDEDAKAIIATTDGNFILLGYTSSKGAGSSDMWAVKIDEKGSRIWDKTYGGSSIEQGNAITRTKDNGFILAGSTMSYGEGSNDMWVVKINNSGDTAWTKTFGGSSNDAAYAIAPTKDSSNFIITGYTDNKGIGDRDVWAVKIDEQGNKVWDKTFGGSEDDEAYAIAPTKDDGFILAGLTSSKGAGNNDMYAVKIDKDGLEIWEKTFGSSLNDEGRAIIATTDDNFIIAGYAVTEDKEVTQDMYAVKINKDGVIQWTFNPGEGNISLANAITATADGNFVLAGYTRSQITADWNAKMIKINDAGNKSLFNKTYGGSKHNQAHAITTTVDGGYIIAGFTESKGAGGKDMWALKIDKDGNL